jgi:hypothetical protein
MRAVIWTRGHSQEGLSPEESSSEIGESRAWEPSTEERTKPRKPEIIIRERPRLCAESRVGE